MSSNQEVKVRKVGWKLLLDILAKLGIVIQSIIVFIKKIMLLLHTASNACEEVGKVIGCNDEDKDNVEVHCKAKGK